MIIEHRTRDKPQNADISSKKTDFYEMKEQREADRPEKKFIIKSGKPIDDSPELPTEHRKTKILGR